MKPYSILFSKLAMMLIFPGALTPYALATAKTHVISFGKWSNVLWLAETGSGAEKPVTLKVRALMVDTRLKEFTLGPVHEITDRLFVVRRAFRVNDSLPQETDAAPHWQWQRGGWLLVDRVTGRVSAVNLPEFDPFYSAVSWYRDYAAYCGVSDDGKKIYTIVAQVSRRKPVLKKTVEGGRIVESDPRLPLKADVPDSACPLPIWQRAPTRVAFDPSGTEKETYAIRGHVVDLISEEDDTEEAAAK